MGCNGLQPRYQDGYNEVFDPTAIGNGRKKIICVSGICVSNICVSNICVSGMCPVASLQIPFSPPLIAKKAALASKTFLDRLFNASESHVSRS